MALSYIGMYNGFVPQLTGQLIAHIRKPADFALNEYVQMVPTKTLTGLYWVMGRDEFVRNKADDQPWYDGTSRKDTQSIKVPYSIESFTCVRRNEKFEIGEMAIEQAEQQGNLPLQKSHADAALSITMTKRTSRFMTLLETESTWTTSDHSKTSAQLTGATGDDAKWKNASDDPSSPSYNIIWKALTRAYKAIHRDTNGHVKMTDLVLVINPELAMQMAQSAEITNYVRQTESAVKHVEGKLWSDRNLWGLPPEYRGFKICVEDAMQVSENKALASGTTNVEEAIRDDDSYIKSTSSALLVSRPGGLDGTSGPSFSTVQLYHKDGLLQVEAFSDKEDRLIRGHVSETVDEVLSAPYSGFKINGVA